MRKILMEVCCGSADDVVQARKGGANRVELNSCLFHGGLTPSVGELIAAKEAADLPIMAMVRPRQGGFCYTDLEFARRWPTRSNCCSTARTGWCSAF